MHVVIEARALSAPSGGVRTYVDNLLRGVRQFPAQREKLTVTALYDARVADDPTGVVVRRGPDLLLPWWLHVRVPRAVRALQPDVVHFTKAAVPRRRAAPTVVTIYDVIPLLWPRSQRLLRRWYWPRALTGAVRDSDAILTISEASKRDIVRLLEVPPAKVTVTPLAVDGERFAPAPPTAAVQKLTGGLPYVLFVGTIEPRKNVPLLVRAFARAAGSLPHRLLIVGRPYKGMAAVRRAVAESGVSERVVVAPFAAPADLPALYANASLFVWPSIYEGWGLPPLEAMACGAPVVVSDGGSLPEVVGEGMTAGGVVVPFTAPLPARTRDAVFEERLVEAMVKLLSDARRTHELSVCARARAASFTWQRTVEQTVQVYERCARGQV